MATPLDSLGIVHETDVLILGAGASGCGAALSASRHGLRVLLADKGKLESCGSLGGGNDHFMAVLNTDDPGDTTETIVDFYCTPTSGYSPSQVRQWVEAMPRMIEVLKSLGIEFLHNADGSFYRTTGFGQPGSWWTHINNGKYIKRRLAGLIRSQGVDVLEYVQCTKILVQDGKAVGAAGFHVLDGTFHIIRAKTVISALGRLNGRVSVNSSLNPFNSAFSPFITGSQIALPYEAGAQIITLDTEQEATLLPKGWGCPGMNGITSSGAKGINALGPRYMGKYHPLMEIGPRYLLIQGTHRELTEGNGPPFVLDVAPMLVLFAIVMTFCILGCFLPSMPLLLICVPIFVPIAKVFGWDLIWFGVIITVLDNMASITPPFGISLFVMKEVAGVTLGAMYRSAVPFVIALFVCLLLIVLFPSLATYLPTLMNG